MRPILSIHAIAAVWLNQTMSRSAARQGKSREPRRRHHGAGPTDRVLAQDDWSDVRSRWTFPGAGRWAGRLARKLEAGLDLTSHYSGTGAAEVTFAKIAGDRLVSHSACDIQSVCQDVLLHHSGPSAPHHVFADMCDRPPAEVMERLRRRLKEVQAEAGIASPAKAKPARASTP